MKVVPQTWILLKGNSSSMFYVYRMILYTIYTYMYTHTYMDTQSSTMGKNNTNSQWNNINNFIYWVVV